MNLNTRVKLYTGTSSLGIRQTGRRRQLDSSSTKADNFTNAAAAWLHLLQQWKDFGEHRNFGVGPWQQPRHLQKLCTRRIDKAGRGRPAVTFSSGGVHQAGRGLQEDKRASSSGSSKWDVIWRFVLQSTTGGVWNAKSHSQVLEENFVCVTQGSTYPMDSPFAQGTRATQKALCVFLPEDSKK